MKNNFHLQKKIKKSNFFVAKVKKKIYICS